MSCAFACRAVVVTATPQGRERARIEADLKAGYVTREGARRDYGYESE